MLLVSSSVIQLDLLGAEAKFPFLWQNNSKCQSAYLFAESSYAVMHLMLDFTLYLVLLTDISILQIIKPDTVACKLKDSDTGA